MSNDRWMELELERLRLEIAQGKTGSNTGKPSVPLSPLEEALEELNDLVGMQYLLRQSKSHLFLRIPKFAHHPCLSIPPS